MLMKILALQAEVLQFYEKETPTSALSHEVLRAAFIGQLWAAASGDC